MKFTIHHAKSRLASNSPLARKSVAVMGLLLMLQVLVQCAQWTMQAAPSQFFLFLFGVQLIASLMMLIFAWHIDQQTHTMQQVLSAQVLLAHAFAHKQHADKIQLQQQFDALQEAHQQELSMPRLTAIDCEILAHKQKIPASHLSEFLALIQTLAQHFSWNKTSTSSAEVIPFRKKNEPSTQLDSSIE